MNVTTKFKIACIRNRHPFIRPFVTDTCIVSVLLDNGFSIEVKAPSPRYYKLEQYLGFIKERLQKKLVSRIAFVVHLKPLIYPSDWFLDEALTRKSAYEFVGQEGSVEVTV